MKKIVVAILSVLITFSSPVFAREEITQLQEETDALYRPSPGANDGAFTALSSSMLGWGVGIATILTIVVLAINANGN